MLVEKVPNNMKCAKSCSINRDWSRGGETGSTPREAEGCRMGENWTGRDGRDEAGWSYISDVCDRVRHIKDGL